MFLAYDNYQPPKAKASKSTRQERRIATSKPTKRYVAGQKPQWAEFAGSSDEEDLGARYLKATSNHVEEKPKIRPKYEPPVELLTPRNKRSIKIPEIVDYENKHLEREEQEAPKRREITAPEVLVDERLERLENFNSARREVHGRRRRDSSSDSDEQRNSDDDFAARRARAKQKIIMNTEIEKHDNYDKNEHRGRRHVKKPEIFQDHNYVDSDHSKEAVLPSHSEESSDSSSSQSSEESVDIVPKLKPVFVNKKNRMTLEDEEDLIQKQEELKKKAEQTAEERRAYTLSLVEGSIQQEREAQDLRDTKISMHQIALALQSINTDEEDEEIAFKAWKKREFERLKRDKLQQDKELEKEEEIARRAELDEDELLAQAYERKIGQKPKERQKQNYLQRYYHKGAFYHDDDEAMEMSRVRGAAATLEDKFDRSVLPEVMQTKYFGKRSQTKHTHLAKEDTSRKDAWGHGLDNPNGPPVPKRAR